MNKSIAVLAAAALIYWLYKNAEEKQSMDAFLSGGDYNEIYPTSWWG